MNYKAMIKLLGFMLLIALVASACGGAPTTVAPTLPENTILPQVGANPAAVASPLPADGHGAAGEADKGGAPLGEPEVSGSGPSLGGGYGGGASPLPAPTMAAGMMAPGEAPKSGLGAGEPAVMPPADSASVPGGVAPAPSGGGLYPPPPPRGYIPPDQQFQAALTAGEVDDNKDFAAYLQYRTDYMRFNGAPVHDLDISERHAIRVRTQNGLPVLGAQVMVYDGQNLVASIRTTATGIAYFFPLAVDPGSQARAYTAVVQKDQATKTFNLLRQNKDDVWDVTLNVSPTQAPVKLDVLFLLDSTGSMGDEIQQLKDNLLSISAQVNALPAHPDVRFGLVTYRDRGDQYVVRVSDFTSNVQEFQTVLSGVQAAGGGDEPESLNEAMHDAISGQQIHWRVDNTVSLVFLISDAPPHLDYPQDYDYAQEMINAAAQGIKIHPIAASNTNDQAEYIFRQIGQFTGGHFIFLTYQQTPQSNGEPGTTHHVQEGSYTNEDLDVLVVKLIQEELAQLTAVQGQQ